MHLIGPGAPIKWTDEHFQKILDGVETGKSIASICRGRDMPSSPWFYQLINRDPDALKRYRESVDRRADFLAQEILDIADEPMPENLDRTTGDWINRKRMQIDARKWTACKLKPKAYGDRLDVNVEQRISITQALEEAKGRLIEGQANRIEVDEEKALEAPVVESRLNQDVYNDIEETD